MKEPSLLGRWQMTEDSRRSLFFGIVISAPLVAARAVFPKPFEILFFFLIIGAVAVVRLMGCLFGPVLGGLVIWGIVRWINRRDDPRHSDCSDSDGKSERRRKILSWSWGLRLIWFVMGAAIPYLGWTVYRWTAEPPLLSAHARLMTLLIAGDSERAYRLTTDEYQAKHSDLEFQSAFGHMRGDDLWGKSASVISMGVDSAQVYCRPDPGFLEWLSGPIYHYVREQGEWRFTGKVEHPVD